MVDCIYTPFCTYKQCDLACPIHAEISYWMERCNLDMNSSVLHESQKRLDLVKPIVENTTRPIQVIKSVTPVATADLISYYAICLYGHGTALNGGIYNLNYSEYLEETKRSWQTKYEPEDLEFMRIWSNSSDYLVISHLDYVKFNDFESQTLLNLMQSRDKPNKFTYIVIPNDLSYLVGYGSFFKILQNKLGGLANDKLNRVTDNI